MSELSGPTGAPETRAVLANPDLKLVTTAKLVERAWCELGRAIEANDAAEWINRLSRQLNQVRARLIQSRATTLEGLRSKAEIVKLADYEDEELTRSIIRDLLDL